MSQVLAVFGPVSVSAPVPPTTRTLTGADSGTSDIVIDATTPTAKNVSSTSPDRSYGIGQTITIQIAFSEAVAVNSAGGTPTLALNSGGTATFTGGSGTTILTFTYIVGSSDTTNGGKLDYKSTAALILNGATITNAGNVPAKLILASPGAIGSLSYNDAIVIT